VLAGGYIGSSYLGGLLPSRGITAWRQVLAHCGLLYCAPDVWSFSTSTRLWTWLAGNTLPNQAPFYPTMLGASVAGDQDGFGARASHVWSVDAGMREANAGDAQQEQECTVLVGMLLMPAEMVRLLCDVAHSWWSNGLLFLFGGFNGVTSRSNDLSVARGILNAEYACSVRHCSSRFKSAMFFCPLQLELLSFERSLHLALGHQRLR
jgi:hypothetical protein